MDRHDQVEDMQAWLDMWLTGWRTGDAQMILRSVADEFVYDDPVDGRFQKAAFAVYLDDLFASEAPFVTMAGNTALEEITDVVAHEQNGELTAWGWWQTASAEGAGLVRVGPKGVLSRRPRTTAVRSDPRCGGGGGGGPPGGGGGPPPPQGRRRVKGDGGACQPIVATRRSRARRAAARPATRPAQ
jgi:hypothetical protein